jgi:hypothetical protein
LSCFDGELSPNWIKSFEPCVRLNKAYPAIYVINQDGGVEIVEVQEVNKHEY